jgi:hypothetical protein
VQAAELNGLVIQKLADIQIMSPNVRFRGLRVCARREGSRFLVAHLNKLDFLLARAERFNNAVYAVSRQPENGDTT